MSAPPPRPPQPPGPPPVALPLPDALLLLGLDPATGRPVRATELDPGLAGAVLLELVLQRRAGVPDRTVVVLDPAPTGDPVLDEVLARLVAAPRERSAKHWVQTSQRGLRRAVADRLVASGALQRRETRVLRLFPRVSHPAGDPAARAAVQARLAAAVLHGASPDERTAALAALVRVTGLRRAVFPGADRRTTDARLEELSEGDRVAAAGRRAIRDVQADAAAAGGDGGGGGGDGGG